MQTPYCLPTVYLNGAFMPLEDAKISPLDRGFIFGDGVYEVIPYFGGKGLRAQEHLVRFARSMALLDIANPHSIDAWIAIVEALVAHNKEPNAAVYMQVTRGVAKRDFSPSKDTVPTVFLMANKLIQPPASLYENGLSCVSGDDARWGHCNIKATALLGAVMHKHEANQAGADEIVLFRDGFLTESSASNVAMVKDGVILCPPMDNLILSGITYQLMQDLARANGMAVEARKIRRREVFAADELWMMSSTKDVIPITKLDGKLVGTGKPGALFKKMSALFQDYKAKL